MIIHRGGSSIGVRGAGSEGRPLGSEGHVSEIKILLC